MPKNDDDYRVTRANAQIERLMAVEERQWRRLRRYTSMLAKTRKQLVRYIDLLDRYTKEAAEKEAAEKLRRRLERGGLPPTTNGE